ncbi:HVO_2523 family zinc finger protein [Natrialba sp. INN-245]|uniref:HVO_2523 family zinc finger protein n=1 Tax=Natrialba sp. INN-245 TaxID=2690967 RepID=UPI00130FD2FB|nr:HVO_2523 family zinc finger protein [Natrialba sp. INN-245]MWV39576.1 hypothetical protein [Natrialba sp. INN-245]
MATDRIDETDACSSEPERSGSTDRSSGPTCPSCEMLMYKRHCKYVCPQHGVVIDCSDPFL